MAGRPHEVLGEVPVAYVVAGPSGVEADAVIERCRRELSTFKLPEEVYEVAGVPRTASGKIQRRLLADQPAVLRCTASGVHDGVLRLEWVPAPARGTAGPAPTTWAFVGSAAAGLAAAAGSSSCYADLATAGAAEMTVLLAPDMPGTWASAAPGSNSWSRS
ncbi:hypothetical protein Srubr_81550 [Streptomyces rubradiris]|uniref:AMP-binding enzyme C-terminal domain-containing protein n=1 Tax=Streptomyces rubradiris TaxID=285531 RepID=A0ABQ3RR25_STRRR|nr:hypothetical protein [Streptomyces rubradiris]GHI58309.1 hypothetical protein Srubr_81550 [Streptomyces rubradiris]